MSKSGGRSIPYELLKEQWNEYVFSDQTVVRVRLILTHVFQDYELGPYRVLTQKMTLVSAPDASAEVSGESSAGSMQRWMREVGDAAASARREMERVPPRGEFPCLENPFHGKTFVEDDGPVR